MKRTEKENRILKQDGKVFEIKNLKIEEEFLAAAYTIKKYKCTELSSTGYLKLFELNTVSGETCFAARWDGGSREPGRHEREELDIDIIGVTNTIKRKFRNEMDGYSGHHAKRIKKPGIRLYDIQICIPSGKIFSGKVSFTLLRKQELATTSHPESTLKISGPRKNIGHFCSRIIKLIFNNRNVTG